MKTSPLFKACSAAAVALSLSAFACSQANAMGTIKLGEHHFKKEAPAQESPAISNQELEKNSPRLDILIDYYMNARITKDQFLDYIRSHKDL